ncbi:uncharacterized protein PHACADRAFT_171743 [Phanerochaete carnosa HHB-10118-sp]|uniref:Uncharacterized protein n=1 Tax=Phanerochaete carnosa (strain HHB-10118-sp) TaxID=650164 RepID=K5WGL8_PHACS|nr:uncharacterized protein PHACADRAFT_171743 [Phanerochaete carnosa HHB-10118-sp]EKM58465.1 hypothetical protein PHACADRAFT_171743 [Phanerochaete carnosa HHB-10118-sp]
MLLHLTMHCTRIVHRGRSAGGKASGLDLRQRLRLTGHLAPWRTPCPTKGHCIPVAPTATCGQLRALFPICTSCHAKERTTAATSFHWLRLAFSCPPISPCLAMP